MKDMITELKTYLERIKLIKKSLLEENFTHLIFSGRFALFCCAMLTKNKYKAKIHIDSSWR
ncbi:MAG: hypothetical protein R2942_19485 [Ignavibacteria bacterium]